MTGLLRILIFSGFLIQTTYSEVVFTIDHKKPILTQLNHSFLYLTFENGFSILQEKVPFNGNQWTAYLINKDNQCQLLQFTDSSRNYRTNLNFDITIGHNYAPDEKSLGYISLLETKSSSYCYVDIENQIPKKGIIDILP